MGKWTDRLVKDPTEWILEKACPPIRYRTLTEIHGRELDDPEVASIREEIYNYKPATTIAGAQSDDGTWFHSLLGFEPMNLSRQKGPGTASQFHALVEYGWGKDHPIIWRTSELLQALLWEDPSIDLYELKGYCGGDPEVEVWVRRSLSRMALALLCRAGFEDDPSVKHKAPELLAQLSEIYDAEPNAIHQAIYTGTLQRTIETDDGPTEESCAVMSPAVPLPDYFLAVQLAWCPILRDSEVGQHVIRRLADYLFSRPAPEIEVVEVGGKVFDRPTAFPSRNMDVQDFASQKRLGHLLHDLELLARWGVLESIPRAVDGLEWVLSLQDDEGIVRAEDFVEKVPNPLDYHYFPLEDNWRGRHKKFTDVTFRLYLILTLLDRAQG